MAAAWNRAWMVIAATALAACESTKSAERDIPELPPSGGSYAGFDDPAPGSLEAPIGREPSESELALPPSAARVHVVKKGDTLFSLARQYYRGDASKWQRIYEANRDRIKDRNTIKVGQELVIPD